MLQMLEPLAAIMARLRDPEHGCSWDLAQTFETIAPYTVEEAYEVADAIERGDLPALKDELGDLQLQVVFHARIAEDLGTFTLGDVIQSVCDKMVRRHPHVFGDSESPGWEAIKEAERQAQGDPSALAGVARALPALLRAEKLQKRAARTGFDWPDPEGPRAKILEELDEIACAQTPEDRAEEIGDLLFSAVNLARHLGIDPEAALRRANDKFERRFRAMEQVAGDTFRGMTLDEKESLWRVAKNST
jgi:ATP diphosphatase